MRKILVTRAHVGLGDQIYYRPFVERLDADVWMPTPWPELWEGTGVRPVREDKGLRTQARNAARAPEDAWCVPPADAGHVELRYTPDLRSGRSIFESIRRQTRINLSEPGFRIGTPWPIPRLPGRKVAVFHPPTVRKEWAAPSRNPKPEYLQAILRWLKDDGYTVIGVGFLEAGEEELVGRYEFDIAFMGGELHYTTLLSLIAMADLVVSGPGFFVPACLATKGRCLIVFGGHVSPHLLVDDMAHDGWHHVAPEPFCHCLNRRHDCHKDIGADRLREAYEAARDA